MSRAASLGLASSCCLSLRHARFIAARRHFRGAFRVRVYAKPCSTTAITYSARGEDVDTARNNISTVSFNFGPSLQRGRRLSPRQFETLQEKPFKKSLVEFNSQVGNAQIVESNARSEQREDPFLETNLLNAKELAAKLMKEDGTVKKFVKGAELDRESFTRVFDLVALRVPADECGVYVSRLKGHLLNWPRVKNVPRVEGDDGDAALKSLLWKDNQALDTPESLIESVRSALYPEDSEFDGEETVKSKRKFPNLRKLTRGVDSDLVQAIRPHKTGRRSSRNAWEEGAVTVEVFGECQKSQNHGT